MGNCSIAYLPRVEKVTGALDVVTLAHLAMAHEHCSTYVNEEYGISICRHTKKTNDLDFGRTYMHFMYKGVVYKTKKKFLEAFNKING